MYNLDCIDNDDDDYDDDRLALSSVLPNASLCLDCGASRIAVTLFVYRRPYSASTCADCTACRVELAHLAQLVLAVTLFVYSRTLLYYLFYMYYLHCLQSRACTPCTTCTCVDCGAYEDCSDTICNPLIDGAR